MVELDVGLRKGFSKAKSAMPSGALELHFQMVLFEDEKKTVGVGQETLLNPLQLRPSSLRCSRLGKTWQGFEGCLVVANGLP